MITMDDNGNIDISLITPEEIRQAIADEMQQLDREEAYARTDYSNEMQRIEARRDVLEEMWRKTYEAD